MSAAAPPHIGKVAVVSGAAQGIGRAIACELARGRAAVALVDINRAEETLGIIRAAGGVAECFRADVSSPEDVAEAASAIRQLMGPPAILVNNAGIFPVIAWDDLSYEDWRRVMAVNLDGAFLMCKAFGPMMEEIGWGRIVNIVTSAMGAGVTHFAHYIASKMGVVGLTRALASEYGPRGVTVNAVAPSLVRTPTTLNRAAAPGGLTPSQEFALLTNLQAIKRAQEPEDVAAVASFLASEGAAFMTGQTLFADGGIVRV